MNRSPPHCKPWRSNINPTAVGNFQLRAGHPLYRVNEEVDYSAAALAVTKTKNATKTKKRRAI